MQYLLTVIDRRFGITFQSNLIKGSSSSIKFRGKLKQSMVLRAVLTVV